MSTNQHKNVELKTKQIQNTTKMAINRGTNATQTYVAVQNHKP